MSTTDALHTWEQPGPDIDRAVGLVPVTARGSLPFMLLDNEPLVGLASWALEAAGVELLDFDVSWEAVRRLGRPLAIHDPLCPLTPVSFLAEAVAAAFAGEVVVGVRPVTDTVKTVSAGVVGQTVDREGLWTVASPVVLPAAVVADLDDWPDVDDLATFAGRLGDMLRDRLGDRLRDLLGDRAGVTFLEAPALARRIDDESDLRLLEALVGGSPDGVRPGA